MLLVKHLCCLRTYDGLRTYETCPTVIHIPVLRKQLAITDGSVEEDAAKVAKKAQDSKLQSLKILKARYSAATSLLNEIEKNSETVRAWTWAKAMLPEAVAERTAIDDFKAKTSFPAMWEDWTVNEWPEFVKMMKKKHKAAAGELERLQEHNT